MYAIYIITNTINAKQYVGIAKNLQARWNQHKSLNKSSPYLHAAIKKHGVDAFIFTHFATAFDRESACLIEQTLIVEHNTKAPHGYNLTDGGEGARGAIVEQKTRSKLSQASKTMWLNKSHIEQQKLLRSTDNYRQKQSENAKKAWAKPELLEKLKKPKNHGEKIRQIKLGTKQSEETIAKRIAKTTGQKRSEETKAKMSASNKAAWVIRRAMSQKETT